MAHKKGGALAALLSFGGKSSDPAEGEDGSRYSKGKEPTESLVEEEPETEPDLDELTVEGAAFASLANALGIPEPKRKAAKAALTQFVKACSKKDYDEEE